ncbi:MAG: ABC transporter permease, partial [Pirellulales bacterium]
MTTDTTLSLTIEAPAPDSPWQRVEAALVWLGDRLNPILVKETRQALKSRQFVITFTLVLALAWIWSIFGVAMIGPSIYFAARGLDMFLGYYAILAVPLLVVVPFGAFRSLASEREDGTYELLSITTLKPRQIISGKLGSAVLQMLVYLSAVAPCLAFTYMLRGIDAPTILYVICCFFLASLGASVIGLLVATLTHEKHWQIVLSVLFLFALAMLLWLGLMMGFAVLADMTPPFQERTFWVVNAILFTAYATYFALCHCAASAQLTFVSDNRSTALRLVMVVQQALCIGWFGWGVLEEDPVPEALLFYFVLVAIHWSVMGIFINTESGDLSLRVKRQLPQSVLGRVFLTWFNPGPATGFMFVAANLLAALLIGGGLLFYSASSSRATMRMSHSLIFAFGVLAFSYVVLYLGLGRILIGLLRRVTPVALVAAVLLQVRLVLAA